MTLNMYLRSSPTLSRKICLTTLFRRKLRFDKLIIPSKNLWGWHSSMKTFICCFCCCTYNISQRHYRFKRDIRTDRFSFSFCCLILFERNLLNCHRRMNDSHSAEISSWTLFSLLWKSKCPRWYTLKINFLINWFSLDSYGKTRTTVITKGN